MEKVVFRKATIKDVEQIVELCDHVFEDHTTLSEAKKVFRATEWDDHQIYLVGEIDGKIVAHTKITIVPTIFYGMGTYAVLNHVCVDEKYRRRHIGAQMLEECFKIAKANRCKHVFLWSFNFRHAAHAMYKKYGFEPLDATFFEKVFKEEK